MFTKDGKSARFSRKVTFGRFWRLLVAFWESWKAKKKEAIMRRRTHNTTHAYWGCAKEKIRHVYWGCTKVTRAHADRGSAKKKIRSRYFESESESVIEIWSFDHLIWTSLCEWEWEWDSSGVDGWIELLHGVILLQNYCKDSSDWFILESPFLFICDYYIATILLVIVKERCVTSGIRARFRWQTMRQLWRN